jgi:hypothetical protein
VVQDNETKVVNPCNCSCDEVKVHIVVLEKKLHVRANSSNMYLKVLLHPDGAHRVNDCISNKECQMHFTVMYQKAASMILPAKGAHPKLLWC